MKKVFLIFFVLIVSGSFAETGNAQMMGGFSNSSADWNSVVELTLREEQEGKELWNKFQAKEIGCTDITNEQFGALGEYFMGTMMGNSHASMNAMMIQAHGEEGEEQIHIVMGKRLSGCDTTAVASGISGGWMPMMNMMTGRWASPFAVTNQSNNSMMNFGFGSFGGFGWIFMILWWVLIIAGIVALLRWIVGQPHGNAPSTSALDILKERYAKGEIDKQEFEERKKDIA